MRFVAVVCMLCCMVVVGVITNLWARSKRNGRGADASKWEALAAMIGFIFFVLTSLMQSLYILQM